MPSLRRSCRSLVSREWGASAFNAAPLPGSVAGEDKGIVPLRHCAVSGRGRMPCFRPPRPDVTHLSMAGLESIFEWGRRASDRATSAPATPAHDSLLEAAIAHEQIEVLYQPLIEPSSGRIIGAEALARSPIVSSAEALFARAAAAGLQERLSRLVQRKALRCAAVWEGPLKGLRISLNLLPQDLSRQNYDQWLLDE